MSPGRETGSVNRFFASGNGNREKLRSSLLPEISSFSRGFEEIPGEEIARDVERNKALRSLDFENPGARVATLVLRGTRIPGSNQLKRNLLMEFLGAPVSSTLIGKQASVVQRIFAAYGALIVGSSGPQTGETDRIWGIQAMDQKKSGSKYWR